MTAVTTTFSSEDFRNNFPLPKIRPQQLDVLEKLCDAYNSGFDTIILEAPTGFGKSAVAITAARTLGSSYLCSATKDLQSQYVKDFGFLRAVKGMGNYSCLVKEDFIENKTYACGKCAILDENTGKKITYAGECSHKVVEYGPCRTGKTGYEHDINTCELCKLQRGEIANSKFHNGCRYRTYTEDYDLEFKNTDNERVELNELRMEQYQSWYKVTDKQKLEAWTHTKNFQDFKMIRNSFTPCPYYDQLNKGIIASHSIFNYANFLRFLRLKRKILPEKNLLILDEAHSIESQFVDQIGISVSKRMLQKYIHKDLLENVQYGYESEIEKWSVFLGNVFRELENAIPDMTSEELRLDAINYLQKIKQTIKDIKSNPLNWIVSLIEKEQDKVTKVEFKPLDISPYCQKLFEKCNKKLIMSATILNVNALCRNLGLNLKTVKFIQADSDFPTRNRPVYPMNVANLNYVTLQLERVQKEISNAIDKIMNVHNNEKGIIHCTSYAQVHFIEKYISTENKRRLILTDPEKFDGRDGVIMEHINTEKPTVLISPSLHTGLDLKDERSRFQIIVKVPYPNRADRWIEAKRKKDGAWYNLQTSIKLVQAYGRSVRSKDDWAKTYVLDSGFKKFVIINNLPNWFTQAIKEK